MRRCGELSAYYNTKKYFSITGHGGHLESKRTRRERPNFENTCSTSRRLRLTCLIFLSICWSRWVELIIIPISARYKSRLVLSFFTRLLYFLNCDVSSLIFSLCCLIVNKLLMHIRNRTLTVKSKSWIFFTTGPYQKIQSFFIFADETLHTIGIKYYKWLKWLKRQEKLHTKVFCVRKGYRTNTVMAITLCFFTCKLLRWGV